MLFSIWQSRTVLCWLPMLSKRMQWPLDSGRTGQHVVLDQHAQIAGIGRVAADMDQIAAAGTEARPDALDPLVAIVPILGIGDVDREHVAAGVAPEIAEEGRALADDVQLPPHLELPDDAVMAGREDQVAADRRLVERALDPLCVGGIVLAERAPGPHRDRAVADRGLGRGRLAATGEGQERHGAQQLAPVRHVMFVHHPPQMLAAPG